MEEHPNNSYDSPEYNGSFLNEQLGKFSLHDDSIWGDYKQSYTDHNMSVPFNQGVFAKCDDVHSEPETVHKPSPNFDLNSSPDYHRNHQNMYGGMYTEGPSMNIPHTNNYEADYNRYYDQQISPPHGLGSQFQQPSYSNNPGLNPQMLPRGLIQVRQNMSTLPSDGMSASPGFVDQKAFKRAYQGSPNSRILSKLHI